MIRAAIMFKKEKNQIARESEEKEWYIILDNQQGGPFSLYDLKRNPRFTPDTLVWKKGYKEWTPARLVLEMKELFKDSPESVPLHEKPEMSNGLKGDYAQDNQATLTLQQDPYPLMLLIILVLLLILYVFYFH